MAEKDITEKILEEHNDVFADIVNVLLFNGKEVIRAEELEAQTPRAAYKADGRIREIERDVAKRWCKQNIRIACIGIENQTQPDRDMPLRVFSYDGAEYRAELNGSDRYPVVTLVLYFGFDKRWDKPTSLVKCLNVPDEFLPYVNDYKLNLFEIAYLTDEQVKMFKSDFGIVADYFTQMQRTRDYVPSPTKMKHVQEVLQLLSVMTHDHRYEEAYTPTSATDDDIKGGAINMCEVLDRLINKGKAEGEAKGRAEGEAKGRAEGEAKGRVEGMLDTLKNLVKEGLISISIAAQKAGMSEDAFRKLACL